MWKNLGKMPEKLYLQKSYSRNW